MSTFNVTSTLTQDQIQAWLTDYISFWSITMSLPEDWSHWNGDPQNNIPVQLSNFNSLLSSITTDQFQGLMAIMDSGNPPQPKIGKLLAIAMLSAPYWIWSRLNNLLQVKGTDSVTLNWLISMWTQAYTLSNNQATLWMLNPVNDTLNTWKVGSDSDIMKMYTDPTGKIPTPVNLHSVIYIINTMRMLTFLDDGSANGRVPNPSPSYISAITDSIINAEAS